MQRVRGDLLEQVEFEWTPENDKTITKGGS